MSGMNGWGDGAERNPPIPPIRLSRKVRETMPPERVMLWLKPTEPLKHREHLPSAISHLR